MADRMQEVRDEGAIRATTQPPGWDEAVDLAGPGRARVWRLYMAGCANRFRQGGIAVHQVLGVVPDDAGRSFMPPTRSGW